jgi:hypothetical protein
MAGSKRHQMSINQEDYLSLKELRSYQDRTLTQVLRKLITTGYFVKWLHENEPKLYYELLDKYTKARLKEQQQEAQQQQNQQQQPQPTQNTNNQPTQQQTQST